MKQGHSSIFVFFIGISFYLFGIFIGRHHGDEFLKGQLDVAKAVCANVNIANWVDAEEEK